MAGAPLAGGLPGVIRGSSLGVPVSCNSWTYSTEKMHLLYMFVLLQAVCRCTCKSRSRDEMLFLCSLFNLRGASQVEDDRASLIALTVKAASAATAV